MELAVAPQRERVPVSVYEIGKGLQLVPLLLVVLVLEPPWIGALAWGLYLHKADEGIFHFDCVVGARLKRRKGRFAYKDYIA